LDLIAGAGPLSKSLNMRNTWYLANFVQAPAPGEPQRYGSNIFYKGGTMTSISKSTRPKPFIFVLMPFDTEYDDIYKFGIKGAANEVGAYVERLDEQIFSEGMLDRIFNQISRADVIVADMTGRNPNVFYEVGYAHALGKIVLLLTKMVS